MHACTLLVTYGVSVARVEWGMLQEEVEVQIFFTIQVSAKKEGGRPPDRVHHRIQGIQGAQ